MGTNPLNLPAAAAAAGYYAVEDPAVPGRLTAWQVDRAGQLHRYPSVQRWEPMPPEFREIPEHHDRSAARDRWYLTTYRPWKVAVIDAISADPVTAAEEFRAAYPTAPAEVQAVRQRKNLARRSDIAERRRRARLAEDLVTALLIARGETISAAAERIGRARSTVRDRVASAYAAVPAAREYLPPADATPVDLEAVVAEILGIPRPPATKAPARDDLSDAIREAFRSHP